MIRIFCVFIITSFASGAAAQDIALSAEEFQKFVTGKTLYFEQRGQPFGAEQYFPDKRVIWAFESGECQFGIWFENKAGDICFIYEDQTGSQCWNFLRRKDGRYVARTLDGPVADDLVVSGEDREPLQCAPPDLGV